MYNRYFFSFVVAMLLGIAATSCNSNDDVENQAIEIPGITIDGDVDCCSAEEALQVYKFLQTVSIIPELSTEVDGKYNVFAYSKSGKFHTGYNEIYFVATKKSTGNYIKNFEIQNIRPLMLMTKMGMLHSTPVSASVSSFNDRFLAVKKGWISFLMNTSENGSWTLTYTTKVLGASGGVEEAAINVNPLSDGQNWLKSFKIGNATYYLSLVEPAGWETGANTIEAYVSVKNEDATLPYALATEQFTIEIDPRMPDMGNHTSPDNTSLTLQSDNSYKGTVNLTMTGLWRIHLTVRNSKGEIVAGGDNLSDGFSSLYWDVTI